MWQGGFAGWWVRFWGLVGCVRAWGFRFEGWVVVLGLGGLIFRLRRGVLGLRRVGFGDVVLGFGVG